MNRLVMLLAILLFSAFLSTSPLYSLGVSEVQAADSYDNGSEDDSEEDDGEEESDLPDCDSEEEDCEEEEEG